MRSADTAYDYSHAVKMRVKFKCRRCKAITWTPIHVEYVAFGFETFGKCRECGRKHEIDVFSIE